MKEKIKSLSFWLGLGSAIVIIFNCLSRIFGFEIYTGDIESIILSICSILVFMGIITKKNSNTVIDSTQDELLSEIENKKNK